MSLRVANTHVGGKAQIQTEVQGAPKLFVFEPHPPSPHIPTAPPCIYQLCFFPPRRLKLGQWKPPQPLSDLDPNTQQEARTCLRTNAVICVLLNCLRHDEPLTSRRMGYWLSHVLCIHLQSQSPEEAFLSDVLSPHLVPDGIFFETWRGWAFSKCLIARTDSCLWKQTQ